jgi:hypothetical protein
VTSSELLGSLKYEVDYASAGGAFVGSGLQVSCTNLVTGASKSFFDDETKKVLRESLISVTGFKAPLDIATCVFETNNNGLTASNFGLTVLEGTTPALELVNPTVAISSVQCASKPAATPLTIHLTPTPHVYNPKGLVF